MNRLLVPLVVFIVVLGFLFAGLRLNPRDVPSPLIGRPAPTFRLATLHDASRSLGTEDMRGEVWLLNVWASWCVACREEHPVLLALAKSKVVPIVGLDYKDEPAAGMQWLEQMGDPYAVSIVDRDGRVGIDFGVYGVPETFVIDRRGTIRYKHIGPLSVPVVEQKILPLVRELQKES